MSGSIREYASEPCPVCGHMQWCGRREDGLVLCKRPPTPREVPGFVFRGMAADGATAMYVEAGHELNNDRGQGRDKRAGATGSARSNERGVGPEWITENYPHLVEKFDGERRNALADALRLPVSALDVLPIGWWSDRRWWNPETQAYEDEPGCWAFAESDAQGRIIGLGLRWPTGRKGQLTGGRRGLTLPAGWRELPDPVIVVEGPSDVLAGRAVELNVIGRPSNSGGADFLITICRDRRVIVLGENDRKPDGRCPGRDGAEAVARKLEAAWNRPVPVAFPPDGAKDLRAWVVDRIGSLSEARTDTDMTALGREFLAAIEPPTILLLAGRRRSSRSSRVVVKAFRWRGAPDAEPIHTDRIDVDDNKARARFAAAVAGIEADADVDDLELRLMTLKVEDVATAAKPDRNGQAIPAKPESPRSEGRPNIVGNERQLREIRADVLAAILAANVPPRLFMRSGDIVRVALRNDQGPEPVPIIQALDVDAVRGELSDTANWFAVKHSKQGDDFLVPELPPLAAARDLLAQPNLDLPPLTGVITCPTFASDGSLIIKAGYHAGDGLWLHSSIAGLPPVNATPDARTIIAARDALFDVLADFPFVDRASRANAIAVMLLPFVRSLIAGPTPLHAVDAPTPGTGKDLLVKAALFPALGYEVATTTAARDPDEWRKKITAMLAAGNPAIVWGNISRRLDSEHLAAALTDTGWQDRELGYTKALALPNRAIWAATGNNLCFSRELARRVVWIRLDARLEAPEQRTGFRYPNLLAHIRENRAQLVHAALTWVRGWLVASRPNGPQVMGSFESYAAIMGGILSVGGVADFLANAGQLRRQADSETAEWRVFVGAWWERWHDVWVGVADLATLLWTEGGKRTDLLAGVVTSDNERGALTQLGRRLSAKRDCIVGGFRLLVGEQSDHCGRMAYRLVRAGPQTSDASEGSLPEVCTEVCVPKPQQDNELRADADIRILPEQSSLHACARTRARPPARDVNGRAYALGIGKKYANVCVSPELNARQGLTAADFTADLPQTSLPPPGKSAVIVRPPLPTPSVRWLSIATTGVPPTIIELAAQRDGWTPASWRDRLVQLASRCEAEHRPDRAAEFRRAAAVMTCVQGGKGDA